jgi:uncharacterized membrane protein
MKGLKLLLVPFAAVAFALASGQAFAVATPIDVTAVTDQISAANAPIGLIGIGVLVVVAIIATYKWIKRAV